MNKINNLSILVSSCDKYSELWHPFFHLLFNFWPQLNNKIYLLGGNLGYMDERVINISIKNETSWSDSMDVVLSGISEDYVLLILEDYFINEPVNHAQIEKLVTLMQKDKIGYVQLVSCNFEKAHESIENLGYMGKMQPYRTSLQAAIWDKKILQSLLKSGENPWLFEIYGTLRSRVYGKQFLTVTDNPPISYLNAASRGYLIPGVMQYARTQGVNIGKLNLPMQGRFQRYRLKLRNMLSKYIVQPLKNIFRYEKNLLPETWQ